MKLLTRILLACLLTAAPFLDAQSIADLNVGRTMRFGTLAAGVISPAQITADQDNYAPTGYATALAFRLTSDASRNITGLQGGAVGDALLLINVGAQPIVLKDESASSSAENRFALSADYTLAADTAAWLWYDGTSSRWRLVTTTAASFAGSITSSGYTIATDRLAGRDTVGTGAIEEISVGGGLEFTGSGGIQRSALTGDVAALAGSNSTTIQPDAVALGTDTTGNYVGTIAGDSEIAVAGSGSEGAAVTLSIGAAIARDAEVAAGYQPLDADLTALAALASTGILVRTGTETYATRTITGTAGEIDVASGDGVSGNPTISLPSTITQATTFSAVTTISNTTAATTKDNGALVVDGGLGVENDVQSGGVFKSTRATETDGVFNAVVTGDSVNRFTIDARGRIEWGSGTATRDTNLYRSAADTLRTDDTLLVGAARVQIGTAGTSDTDSYLTLAPFTSGGSIFHVSNQGTGVFTISRGAVGSETTTTDLTISGGHVRPGADATGDLGTSSLRWRDAYLSRALNIGGVTLNTNYFINSSGGQMLIGGDQNSDTSRTDATTKRGRFGTPHYTNAEEPVLGIWLENGLSSNTITYGGGSSVWNAATSHTWYTAGNNTTTTGTAAMTLDNSRLLINHTTLSSSKDSGALVVDGGLGVEEDIYGGGKIVMSSSGNTFAAGSTSHNELTVSGAGDAGGTTDIAGLRLNTTLTGANSASIIKSEIWATTNATAGTASNVRALEARTRVTGAGNVTSASILYLFPEILSTGGVTNQTYITLGAPSVTSTGDITGIARGINIGNVGRSSATTVEGILVNDLTKGSGNVYAIHGSVSAGSGGKYNLFMDGTAPNHLAGELHIGSTTDAGNYPLQVTISGFGMYAGINSSSNGSFIVTGAAASNRDIFTGATAGVARWIARVNNVAESGSDAGSNFVLNAYTDAGTFIDSPISVTRVSGGDLTISRPLVLASYTQGSELGADPAAPAANGFRLYAKDSGGGKTQLAVRFATGAVQIIATEP